MKSRVWFGGRPPKEPTWEEKRKLGEAHDELLAPKVEEWVSRKPVRPKTDRPEEPPTINHESIGRLLLGVGVVVAVMVILAGAGMMNFGLMVLGILGIVAFPAVIFFGVMIPWFIVEWLWESLWVRHWRLSGWKAYEGALESWKEEGEELREKTWGFELHDRISQALR